MNVTIGGIARTVEITSFDKLGDVKVCMLTTTADGSVGFQQLNQEVIDAIDSKAVPDGTYEDMVVGSAEQLLSTQYDTDSVPYAFRKSPYGDREFDEIVGGSIAWNQLHPISTKATATSSDVTFTNNNDGSITANGTATATALWTSVSFASLLINGHKYLLVGCPSGGGADKYQLSMRANNGSTVLANDMGSGVMYSATSGLTNIVFYLRIVSGVTVNNIVYRPQLFDLTQMFGSTVADAIYAMEQSSSGSGVAFFRSLFPKPYYAFNAGQLISVSGLSAHKMTGKNQVPTTGWGQGQITAEGGINNASYAVSSPYILLDGGYSYMLSRNYPDYGNGQMAYHTYDLNKTHLSDSGWVSNNALISPSEDCYIRITTRAKSNNQNSPDITPSDVGTMFTVQLEFGTTATTYEPYESHSYSLDSSLTLRGVPKLVNGKMQFDGDIYQSDGSVERRYGIITATEIKAMYNGFDATLHRYSTYLTGNYNAAINQTPCNAICNVMPVDATWSQMQNFDGSTVVGGIYHASSWNYTRLYLILPSTVTTKAQADTWLDNSGIQIVYELATPTTESASPYVNPQICNEYGTEEYISAEQSGVTMIVGHNTKYPQNLRKKIEGLPWNFSNLIAPTEVTNKATRNYTVGSFLIMNNTLYKVTSAIANGGTITVGSNVSATTIMQEILAL